MVEKLILTVPAELKARVEGLVDAVQLQVTPSAGRAVNQSTVGQIGIEDLLKRYEKSPTDLAVRLGLSPQASEEV